MFYWSCSRRMRDGFPAPWSRRKRRRRKRPTNWLSWRYKLSVATPQARWTAELWMCHRGDNWPRNENIPEILSSRDDKLLKPPSSTRVHVFSWRRSEHTDRNLNLTKGSTQNHHYSKRDYLSPQISIHEINSTNCSHLSDVQHQRYYGHIYFQNYNLLTTDWIHLPSNLPTCSIHLLPLSGEAEVGHQQRSETVGSLQEYDHGQDDKPPTRTLQYGQGEGLINPWQYVQQTGVGVSHQCCSRVQHNPSPCPVGLSHIPGRSRFSPDLSVDSPSPSPRAESLSPSPIADSPSPSPSAGSPSPRPRATSLSFASESCLPNSYNP